MGCKCVHTVLQKTNCYLGVQLGALYIYGYSLCTSPGHNIHDLYKLENNPMVAPIIYIYKKIIIYIYTVQD